MTPMRWLPQHVKLKPSNRGCSLIRARVDRFLWEESAEIARAANRSAWEAFTASRRIRRQALKMIEQTRRPATLSDLYVIAGQATALMASTAFDLSRWDESATLARPPSPTPRSSVTRPCRRGRSAWPRSWPTGATSPTPR